MQSNARGEISNSGRGRSESRPRDLSDEEWRLIADLVPTYSGPGKIGRPATHDKRDIVNAILYVAATHCRWRSLPPRYPHWNTVHRYHLTWCRDGTWDRIRERLRDRGARARGPSPVHGAGRRISGGALAVVAASLAVASSSVHLVPRSG